MTNYVLRFEQLDRTQVDLAGGKGANLGELLRIDGVRVPPGFCVTTAAFQRIMSAVPSIDGPSMDEMLRQLSLLKPDDREAIREQSAAIRQRIELTAIPDDLAAAIAQSLAQLSTPSVGRSSGEPSSGGRSSGGPSSGGPSPSDALSDSAMQSSPLQPDEQLAFAVRSSATAEDLRTASFAGQHDSYLNVVGEAAVLAQITAVWTSTFTERAVTYRLRNGIGQLTVNMAVVVQRTARPQASGILFTAEPIHGNRKIAVIEANFGLGEALVSGLVNADVYQVLDSTIISKTINSKQLETIAKFGGGVFERQVDAERGPQPALTDVQAVRLVELGRKIEAHFEVPQDIEWCLVDGAFEIVQSRPITTLFPIPESDDRGNHVYVSVGHQQMMTDALKPLGLSFWQMTTPRPMAEAAGRLFVDVTETLAQPASREALLAALGKSDPRIRDALEAVIDRGDFIPLLPNDGPAWAPPGGGSAAIKTDAAIVAELIAEAQASIASTKRDIRTKSGPDLFDFILADIQELKRVQFASKSMQVIMAGMEAAWWLNEQMDAWLGEKNAGFTLTQSVPGNVTSEMGLALLDVADVIRPHADVVAFLQDIHDARFLDSLPEVAGGVESRDAICQWLDKYGMRGVGEIDITRPRWSERPDMLVPIILGNIRNFEPGAGASRFEHGLRDALAKEQDLLERLRALPDAEQKIEETKQKIERVRTFAGYREFPKYFMVSRYFVYKQALMGEAKRLVHAGVLHEREDIFYLRFDELVSVVRTQRVDHGLVRQRKDDFRSYQALTPPRVLTSDGEGINGAYQRECLPNGALVGLPVSAGIIEGRARVILDMATANLEPGDILVTTFTDPSWTPLFVTISGLVTEVGGLMTHGAVIAREYGLPAVVGVEHATKLIRDGQLIRVNGTDGYVEIVS